MTRLEGGSAEFCLENDRKTQKFIEMGGFLRSIPPFLAGTRMQIIMDLGGAANVVEANKKQDVLQVRIHNP